MFLFPAKVLATKSCTGCCFYEITPHCWGYHVQKVNTKAKFYVILFIMINALIWCNFEKNRLGSFWDNPIYLIGYPHGQDLGFFQELEMASVFAIKISIYVVWEILVFLATVSCLISKYKGIPCVAIIPFSEGLPQSRLS